MKIELWKDIPGYKGLYQVSSFGQIRSLYTGKLRSAVKSGHGYHAVQLSKNGVKQRHYVHRLVALAFLPQASLGKNQINHKNCNKSDNRVDNLEWASHLDNMTHAYQNGKIDFRRQKRCDNKSGVSGVYAKSGGYEVTIGHNRKRIYIGYFRTLDEAVTAREFAERGLLQLENS